MMTPLRLLFAVFAFLAFTAQLSAQNCSTPGRYTDSIFANVTESSPILYGRNITSDYGSNPFNPPSLGSTDLYLNVFQPAGDPATKRPLVILAFGGGFVVGQRSDLDSIAMAYAKKGYVVATIDYRLLNTSSNPLGLYFNVINGSDSARKTVLRDVIIKASSDMKAAIRFLKNDAATVNSYNIDTTKIFVGGASAGAIAALHTAYIDNVYEDPNLTTTYAKNGGIEGDTKLTENPQIDTHTSTGIAGVINISGAILDTLAIDANDPPVYNAQGDKDLVIPYQSGGFHTTVDGGPLGPVNVDVPVTFYGAYSIDQRARDIGKTTVLYTVHNGGHETPGTHPYIDTIVAASSAFMKSIVCGSAAPLPVTLSNFTLRGQNCAAVLNWQTATELQSSRFDVETSEDGIHFTKVASVQSKNAANGASYSFRIENATRAAWYRLKAVDIDGAFKYSPAQRFTPTCSGLTVSIFPNPAQSQATVIGLSANMIVDVINAEGKLLWSQKASGETLQLPLGNVEKGLLLIQVKDATGKLVNSTKLVKN
jgi:hypothetical protein